MHNPFSVATSGNFHNVAFFHSLVPKDEAHSKADMKKQINMVGIFLSGT